MEIKRVIVFQLSHCNIEHRIILGHLTYAASKLWNVANYAIQNREVLVNQLEKCLKDNFWYKNLHSQSAQAVLQKLQIAWKNFFDGYTKKPKYQPKNRHIPVKWKKDGFKIMKNKIRLSLSSQTKKYLKEKYSIESNYLWIDLPKNLLLNTVQEVEIVPKILYGHTTYFVHIIYKKEIPEIKLERDKLMGIDFGVKNLASIVIEENTETFIIDGSYLISRLRLLSKEKAKIQSVISKQGYKTSQKFHNLIIKENNFIKDYIHKVSRHIVELAKEKGVSKIVIGGMSDGITNMDIGHKNNEKLHKIPFGRLFDMIKYKAKEYGIEVEKVDEAYTSQTCSVCGIVKKNNRIYRGLYVCSKCGAVMNADINGAINILKRVAPNPVLDRSRGFGSPKRIRVA
ncbi:RNA-guided endonuclease InsQ/TnpB family protein [Caldanaerobius polysaccharolyticus]|uniref:RNA-guided endonuclease InsQ/TnpB family protein n=1 Tax=Caldanaerobius polysaccharolyticus TaxID=44256 RepID=UPI00047EA1D1|nr:RNA-guided endonuclease TnpB family protein [Caldanaerobius polysaccharolyticus]